VLLTNTGPACQLGGYPALVGISLSGEHMTLNPMHGTFFTNPIPGDISRGQQGEFLIGTTDACTALNQPDQAASIANAKANTYVGAILTLPNGAGVISVSGLRFDTACSLDESQVGVKPPQPFTYAIPAGSPQSLSATLRVPASVRSGTEMDYQVVLDNATSTPVALHPCPNYTEVLGLPTRPTGHTYQLNCVSVRLILPGKSRVFAMEIAVPKVDAATLAKFSWALDTGEGPYAGQALRLLP